MGPAAGCDGRDWPHPRREVHFALENDGWNCPLECEVHVWASEGVRRGRRRPALAHPRHHDNPDPRAAVPGEKGSMCAFRRFRVSFPPVLSCLMTSGSARCCDTSRAILGYGA